MKKILWMIMCTLALLMISGCGKGPATTSLPPQTPSKYTRLWSFDLPQDGYVRTGASRSISWESNHVGLKWSSGSIEFNHVYANCEKLEKNGITYYLMEKEAYGQGIRTKGERFDIYNGSRRLFLEKDGFVHQLSASASQKGISLKAASLENALALAVNPDMAITGFEKTGEMWFTEFTHGKLTVSISISPPPFDQQEYDLYAKECTLATDADGLEYYVSGSKFRTEADPLTAGVFVKTDIGTLSIRGGIPNSDRNSVPADSLDFINIELAKSVAAAIRNG